MAKKRILIVEDNDLNIRLVQCLFPEDTYDVISAPDAETCFKITEKQHFDLILMDIQLPDVDGVAATRILRGKTGLNDTPIVMLSSYSMKSDIDSAFEAGCTGYIAKPIDIDTFLETVEGYMR